MNPAPDSDEEFLEQCLIKWLERGDTATRGDLDALCTTRPELRARLRAMAAVAADLPGGDDDRPPDPLLGAVLGNRYRPTARLGAGGMGLVYAARDEQLGRAVALKVLDELFARDPHRVARFRREAELLAALQHPHIVAVHDSDLAAHPPYLVMDHVDGVDLAQWLAAVRQATPAQAVPTPAHCERALRQLGLLREHDVPAATPAASTGDAAALATWARQPWPRAVAELGMQMARALSAAHAVGVVHRDVKPSNFMLDRHGRVQLLDFGLARRDADATLTQSHAQLGTPLYMAPEQMRGDEATCASDIYALGATLYELACLQPPFPTQGKALAERVLFDDPPSPLTLRPRLPRDLAAVCLQALAKAPSQRYPSADALLADLERFVRFEPVLARARTWPTPVRRAIGAYRRYRRGLLGATLVCAVAATITAIAGSTFGADRARARVAAANLRAAEAAELHVRLSPYLGFGGSRADRLADPARGATLAALDRLIALDPQDTVARFLRVFVRGEEQPAPPTVAEDLAALRTQISPARVTRLYDHVAMPLQSRDRSDREQTRKQLSAAWQTLAEDPQPFDDLAQRLALMVLTQLVEVDPDQRRAHVERTREILDRAHEPRPTAFTCMVRGVGFQVDQLLVRALEEYTLCNQLCPDQPATLHSLARLHRLHGNPKAALPFSTAAVAATAAPHPNYLEQHTLVLIALADFPAAEAMLARLPSSGEAATQRRLLRVRLELQRAVAARDEASRRTALAACVAVLAELTDPRQTTTLGVRQMAAVRRYSADAQALATEGKTRADAVLNLLLDSDGKGLADPLNAHLLRGLGEAMRQAGNEALARLFERQATTLHTRALPTSR